MALTLVGSLLAGCHASSIHDAGAPDAAVVDAGELHDASDVVVDLPGDAFDVKPFRLDGGLGFGIITYGGENRLWRVPYRDEVVTEDSLAQLPQLSVTTGLHGAWPLDCDSTGAWLLSDGDPNAPSLDLLGADGGRHLITTCSGGHSFPLNVSGSSCGALAAGSDQCDVRCTSAPIYRRNQGAYDLLECETYSTGVQFTPGFENGFIAETILLERDDAGVLQSRFEATVHSSSNATEPLWSSPPFPEGVTVPSLLGERSVLSVPIVIQPTVTPVRTPIRELDFDGDAGWTDVRLTSLEEGLCWFGSNTFVGDAGLVVGLDCDGGTVIAKVGGHEVRWAPRPPPTVHNDDTTVLRLDGGYCFYWGSSRDLDDGGFRSLLHQTCIDDW